MTDEEIEEMQEQINAENEQGLNDPPMDEQQEPPASPDEYPPVDNTVDDRNSESLTPELDAQTDKFTPILNRR